MEQSQTLKRALLNQACDYCRYRKRKCDRLEPTCTMCQQKKQECRYSENLPWPEVRPQASTQVTQQAPRDSSPDQPQSRFPEVFFLDHVMFKRSGITIPSTSEVKLAPCLLETLEQADSVTKRYFGWAHLWMPIVSKRRWESQFMNPLATPRPDVQLLLCSMSLVIWSPTPHGTKLSPRTEQYLSLKRSLLDAESLGLFSVPLLQSMILTSIYEIGHAIYPAAFMSVGQCVRMGLALGLEKQPQSDPQSTHYDLEEQEERRRVWWAVFILDRIHLHGQPTSPDPKATALLPMDDQDWDDGVPSSQNIQTVGTPSSSSTGMLARLAQAAYLFGKVQRHRRDPTSDPDFNRRERLQLDKSLRALLKLAYQGNTVPLTTICPQTAMCFSALIELHCPDLSEATSLSSVNLHEKITARLEALELLNPIVRHAYHASSVWFRNRPFTMEQATPLLLSWTYQAAVTFMQLAKWFRAIQSHEGFQPGLQDRFGEHERCIMEANHGAMSMMRKLSLLGSQWCAADAYLRILKARIASNIL